MRIRVSSKCPYAKGPGNPTVSLYRTNNWTSIRRSELFQRTTTRQLILLERFHTAPPALSSTYDVQPRAALRVFPTNKHHRAPARRASYSIVIRYGECKFQPAVNGPRFPPAPRSGFQQPRACDQCPPTLECSVWRSEHRQRWNCPSTGSAPAREYEPTSSNVNEHSAVRTTHVTPVVDAVPAAATTTAAAATYHPSLEHQHVELP